MDPASSLVVVTGAAGFIGSHVVARLLEKGYRVRGTVRSLARIDSYAHLKTLPGAAERLELVEADLLTPGAFDGPITGAHTVIHMAAAYALNVKDPQRDLVDPAVRGSLNVLESCSRVGGVYRVVLTSSMASVTDEPDKPGSDKILTEADWNELSTLTRNPYYYAKTQGERAAWDYMKQEKRDFDLVVINPFIVIGPSMSPATNPSNQIFLDMFKGVYPGIMNLTWGLVDVRDTAEAHVRAMETPNASGRYLCAGETLSMKEAVEELAKVAPPGSKLPRLDMACAVGDFTVRLSSYFQPRDVGTYLRTHVGRVPRYDTSKIRKDLGMEFRPARESVRDTVAYLHARGDI